MIVPQGKTLTIEPGVEIRIKAITDDLSSGDDVNRIEIRVEGQLSAKGTAQDSIRFVSNAQIPAAGDWYGIVSYGSYSGKVTLKYCRLNNYVKGISVTGEGSYGYYTGYVNADTVGVYHSKFYAGGDAINTNSTSFHPVVFEGNKVYDAGIYDTINSSYKRYVNNSFLGSTNKWIYVRLRNNTASSSSALKKTSRLLIQGNTIINGRLQVDNNSYRAGSDVRVVGNSLQASSSYNIWSGEFMYVYSYNANYNNYVPDSNTVEISGNSIQRAGTNDFYYRAIQVGLGQESSKAIVTSNTINNAGGIPLIVIKTAMPK